MKIDYAMIGARIKEARRKRGMTQEALAEALDVSIGYVSQVERGITKISLDLLGAISGILDVDPAHFITGAAVDTDGYGYREVLDGYGRLSVRDKALIQSFIVTMLEK